MHGLLNRSLITLVEKKLENNPVVALLGPRQCGKSTLAKQLTQKTQETITLDLESPRDINKIETDPESFFYANNKKLICLDEIQRIPDLFPVMRSVIDSNGTNGQFLILGSASPELIRQTSESLAGRIAYLELTPFLWQELNSYNLYSFQHYWLTGGFPGSFLNPDLEESFDWRLNYIRTYLERDIPALGITITTPVMRRLWQMCAHMQGQILNMSQLANSLSISSQKVRRYLEILEQTYLVRILRPYESNLKKRIVKTPKIYIRDSGLLHTLLDIETFNDLMGHPAYGNSWEGLVIENIIASFPRWKASFYRTSNGAELDLILTKGTHTVAIECKASSAPKVSKGFWSALEDINPDITFIAAPVDEAYPLKDGVMIAPIEKIIERINSL